MLKMGFLEMRRFQELKHSLAKKWSLHSISMNKLEWADAKLTETTGVLNSEIRIEVSALK
jgi:hypothetical protein